MLSLVSIGFLPIGLKCCTINHVCVLLVKGENYILESIPKISKMKTCKCLLRGCEVFLAHSIESPKKTTGLSDVEFVREYSDIFS